MYYAFVCIPVSDIQQRTFLLKNVTYLLRLEWNFLNSNNHNCEIAFMLKTF